MAVQPENTPNGSDNNIINEGVPLAELRQVNSTAESPPAKKINLSITRRLAIYAIFTILIMITTSITLIVVFLNVTAPKPNGTKEYSNDTFPNVHDGENSTLANHIMFTKNQWGGRPLNFTRPLRHPTEYVVIAHTAGRFCTSYEECAPILVSMQSEHGGNLVIGYNFLIGGDGNVYIGRGWDVVNFYRDNNIGISFIGNFVFDSLTPRMISALKELLGLGVKLNKLPPDYKLVCLNQTIATSSPGANVFKEINKFPNYLRGRVQIQ